VHITWVYVFLHAFVCVCVCVCVCVVYVGVCARVHAGEMRGAGVCGGLNVCFEKSQE
jgi:hypothetical protein